MPSNSVYVVQYDPTQSNRFSQLTIREALTGSFVDAEDLIKRCVTNGKTLCRIRVEIEILEHEPPKNVFETPGNVGPVDSTLFASLLKTEF